MMNARAEQDREDLLAEATALVERVELAVAGLGEHIVIGFRPDGCASFYFDANPAWHFNTLLQLRRAYVAGLLYKAERGHLTGLTRRRAAGEVQLVRHEPSDEQQAQLLAQLAESLNQLQSALEAGAFHVLGQMPAQADVVARIRRWLEALPRPIAVAASPHAR